MRPLVQRLITTILVVDLTFKLLVGLGFLYVIGATGDRLGDTIVLGTKIVVPTYIVMFSAMAWFTRPIDRYVAEPTDEHLRIAARRCAQLPSIIAATWTPSWILIFTTLGILDGKTPSVLAVFLFMIAMLTGPVPVGHTLMLWLVAPYQRAFDLEARERGLDVRLPRATIRGRLLVYALCLAIAPSAYMAAIGVGARAASASTSGVTIAIGAGFGAVAAFAIIVAYFMSASFTRPIVEMESVVRRLGDEDGTRVGDATSVPLHQADELGALATQMNAMIERLVRTERERSQKLEDAKAKLSELALARRIQTSILPQQWNIAGLDIAASMVTADEIGGDYYDILPRPEGGWIGIGDVSGHGVGAGMIMLMLQSITATLVDAFPSAPTKDIVVAIDRLLFENIRRRLGADDFVTFTLLRYHQSGAIHFAGAHEDMIVWRAATQTCEQIATPGTWVGISGKIAASTIESEMKLEPGDVLVLYTDGITEARDRSNAQFGMTRLCAAIAARATDPVAQITAGVIEEVQAFAAKQHDDISIVVARQK